ncbi:hypothetical protein SARC_08314 [Sphaeroforma arctica JP610]|uniref:VOC domain-containing protein n=1 Tax=Sphaeroforma arctica JP610 TaxID=667725 RepID=A0A0L0FRU0_9EUKA|nr:hypothetical protein SARC_08314 [Sphaeroforma arctica JP610]KNC79291.1 hypothetical protein SARC_08314 [Sphaeroforma arctica JP610]|eukprot:XP_014153193.1 hypothetical protein SARC_08314 [Sphaeroforma arctica JP610]
MSQPPTSPDTPGIALLEHVNINIDKQNRNESLRFYSELLNLPPDVRRVEHIEHLGERTVWFNLGPSQMHLPKGTTNQRVRGHLGMYVRDSKSMQQLKERFVSTPYFQSETTDGTHADQTAELVITGPGGNTFKFRVIDDLVSYESRGTQFSAGQSLLKDDETDEVKCLYGKNPSAVEVIGLECVHFIVPKGAAHRIGAFYNHVFGAETMSMGDGATQVAINWDGRMQQSLIFSEVSDSLPDYDGHHIAIYLGNGPEGYEKAYNNVEGLNLVWINPRFSDKVSTLETAKSERQFRFKNIVDIDTGETIYELEHEVRCSTHPSNSSRM